MRGSRWPAAALFVLAFLAFIPWLGALHVWSKDEARPALVAREMAATGQWGIPHLGGRVYTDKPPLYHWVVLALSRGRVTEWSLRLPSALAAAATVAVTYLIGARLVGPAAGLVGAVMLAASPTFFQWARTGRMEALLALWITLAFFSLVRWLAAGRRADALLFGVWIGLGVLTKGPAALIPVLVAMFALLALRGRPVGRRMDLGLGVGVAVVLLVGWMALATFTASDAGRYVGGVGPTLAQELRHRPARHPLYAIEALGLGFLPWSVLAPATAVLLARRWREAWRPLLLPLLWLGVVLFVFTILVRPREVYFLPAYPALALLIGWAWQTVGPRGQWWFVAPLGLVVAGVGAVALAPILSTVTLPVRGVPIEVPPLLGVLGMAGVVVVLGGGGAILWRGGASRSAPGARGEPEWGYRAGPAALVALAVLSALLAIEVRLNTVASNANYPTRPAAARLAARVPVGDDVVYIDRKQVTALMFYLPRRPVEVAAIEAVPALAARRALHMVLPEPDWKALQRLPVVADALERVEMDGTIYVLAHVRAKPAATT